MPLVRTPMIAPTKIYQNVPTLVPEEAADLVVQAIVYKPVRIATRLGTFGEVLHAVMPRIAQIVMNTSFRMFRIPMRPKASGTARSHWNRLQTRSLFSNCCAAFTFEHRRCPAAAGAAFVWRLAGRKRMALVC